MQRSQTTTKQQASLNTQSSADTEGKENSPLLTREPIEKTPFWIVGNDEIGYKITWGKYSFNEQPLKKEDVQTWWEHNQWKIILHLIAIGIGINNIDQKKETPDINHPEEVIYYKDGKPEKL